ncbi:MAG: hypothetical protein M3033_16630 [Acidobacteriota bacterium]|nr:hypothetical protein [Acidobacteriota bacterium]
MKRHWYLIVVLSIVGVLMIGFALIRNHLWMQTNSVKVFYNSEAASNSTVYVSVDGDLMVWAKKGDEKLGVYCILFKERRIGDPYPTELLTPLPSSFLIRNYPLKDVVDIGTEKSFPYAKKTFEENQVIFSLEKGKTFEVDF